MKKNWEAASKQRLDVLPARQQLGRTGETLQDNGLSTRRDTVQSHKSCINM